MGAQCNQHKTRMRLCLIAALALLALLAHMSGDVRLSRVTRLFELGAGYLSDSVDSGGFVGPSPVTRAAAAKAAAAAAASPAPAPAPAYTPASDSSPRQHPARPSREELGKNPLHEPKGMTRFNPNMGPAPRWTGAPGPTLIPALFARATTSQARAAEAAAEAGPPSPVTRKRPNPSLSSPSSPNNDNTPRRSARHMRLTYEDLTKKECALALKDAKMCGPNYLKPYLSPFMQGPVRSGDKNRRRSMHCIACKTLKLNDKIKENRPERITKHICECPHLQKAYPDVYVSRSHVSEGGSRGFQGVSGG